MQAPRLHCVERDVRRHDEHADFAQCRRSGSLQRSDPPMPPVAETDRLAVLEQFDAVEDAAAHVSRTLERIDAVPGDEHRVLARREHARNAFEIRVAEQAAADRRMRHQRDVQVDERRIRVARLRTCCRGGIARIDEGPVHLADRQVQAAHGAFVEQGVPVGDAAGLQVEHVGGRSNGTCGSACGSGAELQHSRNAHGRTRDALADDQHRDRRAADDVGFRRPASLGDRTQRVVAEKCREVLGDTLFGNADQHDRLAMPAELETDDRSRVVDADRHVDRLARIPGRVDEVRRHVDETDALVAAVRLDHRRRPLERAETIGTGDDLRGYETRQRRLQRRHCGLSEDRLRSQRKPGDGQQPQSCNDEPRGLRRGHCGGLVR